jgi:Uma2 family endonuclease
MSIRFDPTKHYWTIEEYFALEKASDRRYEYWDGEIICMSGGKRENLLIQSNLSALLAKK